MKFELYRERTDQMAALGYAKPPDGDWRWRLRANNGNIVAEGGEGYVSPVSLVRTVAKYIATNDEARWELNKALGKHGLTTTGHAPAKPRRKP